MTHLTVGEVAQRSGVAVSALHFYEAKGLITSQRTAGNQRRYERDVLRRVAVIRTAQRVGISLEQIAAALATLPQRQAPTRADCASGITVPTIRSRTSGRAWCRSRRRTTK